VTDAKVEPGLVTAKEVSCEATKDDIGPNEAKSRVKKPEKKDPGPVHITVGTEPTSLHVLGELEPRIFNEVNIFN